MGMCIQPVQGRGATDIADPSHMPIYLLHKFYDIQYLQSNI
jgi:hypothetical protein